MKCMLVFFCLFILLSNSSYSQTKAFIDKETKQFHLVADIRKDHRIFGYSSPDTNSNKLILFSIFTNDVKNNPHNLPLGAYYQTSDLDPDHKILYRSVVKKFVMLSYVAERTITPVYVLRKFVTIDK